ncbi:MAG: ATP-binding cassette domain-containing protein [Chloroflexota bacterium]|nr:ATP-binding cassette domain-containing protein [Chloroflexota bacterium]
MIRLDRVRVTFNRGTVNEVRALREVDLTLADGEFVTVVGSNGAGKSTLLNAIAGVVFPEAGRIEIAGRDVMSWPEHRRAGLIGRVFQNPLDGTAATMTVEENLALALRRGRTRGLALAVGKRERRTFGDLLEPLGMGLERRLSSAVGLLSGGQRQALSLLMATLARPRVLLLDEHTAALDPGAAAEIEALTARLVDEQHLTTLMVTHNMQQALRLGTRTTMLHQGEIALDIGGEDRRGMSVESLVRRFQRTRKQELVDDELLLTR